MMWVKIHKKVKSTWYKVNIKIIEVLAINKISTVNKQNLSWKNNKLDEVGTPKCEFSRKPTFFVQPKFSFAHLSKKKLSPNKNLKKSIVSAPRTICWFLSGVCLTTICLARIFVRSTLHRKVIIKWKLLKIKNLSPLFLENAQTKILVEQMWTEECCLIFVKIHISAFELQPANITRVENVYIFS